MLRFVPAEDRVWAKHIELKFVRPSKLLTVTPFAEYKLLAHSG